MIDFQSYDAKYFKKIKRLKSLQKAEAYLEHKRVSAMELFVNILNGLLFSCKLHQRCSNELYMGLRK